MKKVKAIMALLSVCVLFCMTCMFIACNSEQKPNLPENILDQIMIDGRPDYDDIFDYDSGYEQGGPPEPPVTVPKDPGGENSLRLEAEKQEVKNLVGGNGAPVPIDAVEHYRFDTRFSGGLSIANYNKSNKTELIFKFNSDVAYSNVKVEMLFGSHPENKTGSISSFCTITCNGNDVTPDTRVDYNNETQYCNSIYMRFGLHTFYIQTQEGENEIKFKYVGNNKGGNVEYIEIKETACNLTDLGSQGGDRKSVWKIKEYPTTTKAGKIQVTSSKTNKVSEYIMLPLNEANGYSKETIGDKDVYSITVMDKIFRITADGDEYTG